MSEIRDESLWESGKRKIEWVRQNMSLLRSVEEDFKRDQPFKGLKVALSIHLEAKTAYLCKVLAAGGAEMYITGSNPLSTQDDVAAGLADYENYYKYFGENRFKTQPTYGGTYQNNKGHYDLISEGGQDFIIVYMSWNIYQDEIDWMNQVLSQYSDRKAILCFHTYTNVKQSGGTYLDYYGQLVQKYVVEKNPNVFAVLNGHYHGSSYETVMFDDDGDGRNDRTVYQICTDYQSGFEGMRYSISNTAEYGDYITGPKIITEDTKKAMKQILSDIQDGTFAKDFLLDMSPAGRQVHFKAMRKKAAEHPSEQVGKEIRKLYSWNNEEDKLINN